MSVFLNNAAIYVGAAFFEIAGAFAFWGWFRLAKPVWWLGPGIISLCLFAWLLTRTETPFAGRAFAAYGGVYIAASLVWLKLVESRTPDRWDAIGAIICLIGAAVIIFGPRGS